MQRRFFTFLSIALGISISGMAACGGGLGFQAAGGGGTLATVALLQILNCPATLDLNQSLTLQGRAQDSQGNVLSVPISFQSSRPAFAEINGLSLKARYPGTTEVTASSGGVTSAPCSVEVLPPANTKTVTQLTDNTDEDTWGMNNNGSTTSRGRILWQKVDANGNTDVYLGDAQNPPSLLHSVAAGDVDFMALGTAAAQNEVMASWRENLMNTWAADENGSLQNLGAQMQEENSISGGCLFFRRGLPDNDIFQFSFAKGLTTVSTTGDLTRPIVSECRAVWELQQNGQSSLIYYDGSNETPVISGLPLFPAFDFRSGRLVFSDGGDVYFYDATSSNPQVVNLTQNPGQMNNFPRTDGNSVVYTRLNNGNYEVVLHEIETGNSQVISITAVLKNGNSLRIDKRQAIWMEGADLYFFDGKTTGLINPFPAGDVQEPYLADGLVTWHGPTGAMTDQEIFVME